MIAGDAHGLEAPDARPEESRALAECRGHAATHEGNELDRVSVSEDSFHRNTRDTACWITKTCSKIKKLEGHHIIAVQKAVDTVAVNVTPCVLQDGVLCYVGYKHLYHTQLRTYDINATRLLLYTRVIEDG